MEKITESHLSKFSPWKISTNQMQPNMLLMCKMLLLLLLINGFYSKINDPYIPFLRFLDEFNNFPGLFKLILRAGFIVSGLTLLFNFKPKLSSLVLGIIIITTLLASKPLFRNHIFIVGCVLFLTGLSSNKGIPWLIILQISLVYIGAALNKALQIDWWTGQFMHNWLAIAIENPIYIYISNLLPELWFAKILSWLSILVELTIGVTVLTKKWRMVGVWVMIIFHFAMVTFVVTRFGHFVQDLYIILISFLVWPQNKIIVKFQKNKFEKLAKIIKFLDWDNLYYWTKETIKENNWLEINNNKLKKTNFDAFKALLIYSNGFYILLLAFDFIITYLMHLVNPIIVKASIHLVYCIIIWGLIIAFFPLKLKMSSVQFIKKNLG